MEGYLCSTNQLRLQMGSEAPQIGAMCRDRTYQVREGRGRGQTILVNCLGNVGFGCAADRPATDEYRTSCQAGWAQCAVVTAGNSATFAAMDGIQGCGAVIVHRLPYTAACGKGAEIARATGRECPRA